MKKLVLTMFSVFALAGFSYGEDCKKCKKDGEAKKEEGTLAHCGKCGKEGEHKKDGEADKEAKKEGTVAGDCKKCKKEGEAEKEEGTLA